MIKSSDSLKKYPIILLMVMSALCMNVYGKDCITLNNDTELCGRIEFKTEDIWKRNYVKLNDGVQMRLYDVKRIQLDDKIMLRVESGDFLYNFAVIKEKGKLNLYEKWDSLEVRDFTFIQKKCNYFSLDNQRLHSFSMRNLRKHIGDNEKSAVFLNKATMLLFSQMLIQFLSALPLMYGTKMLYKDSNMYGTIPLGAGLCMATVPFFTLKPLVKKNVEAAVRMYNTKN